MSMGVSCTFYSNSTKLLNMILALICDFQRLIDSAVFVLAAFDFSNKGYGFQKFDYFRLR